MHKSGPHNQSVRPGPEAPEQKALLLSSHVLMPEDGTSSFQGKHWDNLGDQYLEFIACDIYNETKS